MAEKQSLADLLNGNTNRLETANPSVAKAYQNIIDRLLNGDAGSASPQNGDTLPSFLLPNDQGQLVDLADLLAKGPLVVSMNRGHWCSFCRFELMKLQENLELIRGLGTNVVAISPEVRVYANKLRERCGLTFPILCDVDNGYALSLGLAIWFGDEIKPLFAKSGSDLALFHGNPAWMVPIPATYVVDVDGRIVESFVNADFRKRIDPDVMIAALKSL